MRSDPGVVREVVANWRIENLRFTGFIHGDADIRNARWIEDLLGDNVDYEHDDTTGIARTQVIKFGNGRLTLQRFRVPGIIHWVYGLREGEELDPADLRFPEALTSFREIVDRWLEICPSLERVAFGAVLQLPVTDREAGYRKLSDYLVFDLDKDSHDFSYQINRPRHSAVLADPSWPFCVNRLSRWSVAAVATVSLTSVRAVPRRLWSYCRVELDINTPPEFPGGLPRGSLRPILDELVQLGTELVAEGDIK